MRSTTATVTFHHPFTLAGYDDQLPAGSYDVLREDELLEGLSFEAYRRVATFLRVLHGSAAGRSELRPVSDADIDAALDRDRAQTESGPAGG